MKMIAAICLAFFVACQSPAGGPSSQKKVPVVPAAAIVKATPDTTTLGGNWYLQPVLPSDTATGKVPTLQFDMAKSRFTGNTGCNKISGQFFSSGTDSSLSFGEKIAMMTRMACPGYNEQGFLKSLKSTGRYRLQNGVLTLLTDEKTELSHWTRKPPNGPKAIKV
jgi:heat shock protein HslJ